MRQISAGSAGSRGIEPMEQHSVDVATCDVAASPDAIWFGMSQTAIDTISVILETRISIVLQDRSQPSRVSTRRCLLPTA